MNIQNIDTRIVGFVRHLRQEGYNIGIQETLDAMHSLKMTLEPDEFLARNTFRALACHNHDEWRCFDKLFTAYWYPFNETSSSNNPVSKIDPRLRKKNQGGIAGIAGASGEYMNEIRHQTDIRGSGAGRQRNISKADFRFLNDRRAAREAEKLAEKLATLLLRKTRHKYKTSPGGNVIDIRKTLRRSLKYGGLPLKPVYNIRRRELPHLVILHDVSHSMSWNNPLLFRFARGLVRTFPRSEAFAFHTHLFRVTNLYRERSLKVMRERFESKNYLWFGGTCIADSLKIFNEQYAKKSVTRNSVIIIISDGFDTNDPESLGKELKRLKKASARILWLNPMLGQPEFSPDESFLQYAKPHLDLTAPANSLHSLEEIIHYLATPMN